MVTWYALGRIALWLLAIVAIGGGCLAYFAGMMSYNGRVGARGCALVAAGALGVVLLLTGCAPTPPPEPIVRTVEVRVPVDDPACARAARDRLRQEAPAYPDTEEALSGAASVFDGVKLLRAGRLLRIAREAALMGAIEACAAPH